MTEQHDQEQQHEPNEPIEPSEPSKPSEPSDQSDQSDPSPANFSSGDRVRLAMRPSYFKTADPMPMLRPPDIVPVGEHGIIMARRPAGYWAVRFAQGTFLMESQYLQALSNEA